MSVKTKTATVFNGVQTHFLKALVFNILKMN